MRIVRKLSITDEDKSAADMGYIEIIDISGDVPKTYYYGEWTEIELVS